LFGGFSLFPPVIKYLLIANAAVFLLEHFLLSGLKVGDVNLGDQFFKLFALQPVFHSGPYVSPISGPFMPWQLFTYMFMHGSFTHIFFNMFALWMFGLELENIWGSKKFLFYYTICGLGAGLANLFIAPLFSPGAPTVGASGSVYGILVAFGYLFPDRYIYIYFLLPIKAKYLVIMYMALEVFSVASQSNTGIAHVAHLGGAVVGLVYLIATNQRKLKLFSAFKKEDFKSKFYDNFAKPKNEPPKPMYTADYKDIEVNDYKKDIEDKQKAITARIDAILDKLSQSGYQSLTEEEKKTLFEEGKKLR
jgi:membrane associated rhomboid family serine protease